mmetsp:Transcript_11309/g.12618  ORF Transcript_11309/g.12618 Transcript_11309/m.12618 type:complete len:252 (+) Transcript_11309:88-843(+)
MKIYSSIWELPGWSLLLIGYLFGRSVTDNSFITAILYSWQTLVNVWIVPLYSICIFFYIGQHIIPTAQFQKLLLFFSEKTTSSSSSISSSAVAEEILENTIIFTGEEDVDGVVNMTGSYRLHSNDNFEGFLAVQGVPWSLRSLANQARPVHKITHVEKSVTIQIKGIIESQTTYIVDGPPVETNIRGRIFHDSMRYLKDGIITNKATDGYDITVSRRFTSPNRSILTMTSCAIFKDETKKDVKCVQIFKRV